MVFENFRPGFRLSVFDVFVLASGVVGAFLLAPVAWEAAFVVGFVVGHFFLFCNVFRLRRKLELIWAAVFVSLTASTMLAGTPSWPTTAAVSLFLSIELIFREFRTPGYHGIFWQRVNPGLPEWWKQQQKVPESG